MRRNRRRSTMGFSGMSAGVAALAVALLVLTPGCGGVEVSVNGQSVGDLVDGAPESACGVVDALSLDRQALADSGLDPEQLRTTWTTIEQTLDEAGDVVAFGSTLEGLLPEGESIDLDGDWQLLVDGFQTRLALLEEAGFDPAALDDRFDAVSTAEFQQARDSLAVICP